MKQKMITMIGVLGILILASCGNSNGSSSSTQSSDVPGESIGLVLLWVVEGDEATQGTAAFPLHDDDGTYYVDFDGRPCRVSRISPINVGGATLCYTFTTYWGGKYYLEDISDPSKRFYNY